jgi:hypothetical protein
MNRSLRSGAAGAAAIFAGLIATAGPAVAAPVADGTSNTLQFGLTAATFDQARHRVVVSAPALGDLAPGTRLAGAEIVSPRLTIVLTDIMIESTGETASSLALNFTKVAYKGDSVGEANAILYNGHAGLGGARFNVPDVTVIPPI